MIERQRHRLARDRFRQITISGDDARNFRRTSRRQNADRVAWFHGACANAASKAAEIKIGPHNALHTHAQRLIAPMRLPRFGAFEQFDQSRPVIPRRRSAARRDVVAADAGDGNRSKAGQVERAGDRDEIGDDFVISGAVVADQIHLGDGEHDLADAHQREDVSVPARLRQHAFARINQQNSDVRIRRGRHHVARVLRMAWTVRDNELAFLSREIAVGDIDRDALLALGHQPVDEQCEIQFTAARANCFGIALQSCELIVRDGAEIIEQAADQSGLAVIDGAACDEAQKCFLRGHQK